MNPLRKNRIGDPAAQLTARFAPRAHALWKRWRLRHPRSSLWLPQGAAALLVLLASSGVGWLLPCQAAKAGDSIKAAGTSLGLSLLPAVNAVLTPLASFFSMLSQNKAAAIAFAIVIGW